MTKKQHLHRNVSDRCLELLLNDRVKDFCIIITIIIFIINNIFYVKNKNSK